MPPNDCENCAEHSGLEERIKSAFGKINLLIWMLGVLIVILTTIGGALYSSMQSVQISIAGYSSRITALEEKIRNIDLWYLRINERLDHLERK